MDRLCHSSECPACNHSITRNGWLIAVLRHARREGCERSFRSRKTYCGIDWSIVWLAVPGCGFKLLLIETEFGNTAGALKAGLVVAKFQFRLFLISRLFRMYTLSSTRFSNLMRSRWPFTSNSH